LHIEEEEYEYEYKYEQYFKMDSICSISKFKLEQGSGKRFIIILKGWKYSYSGFP